MATKKSQRIGIWIIAITMMVGTIGSFVAMVLGTQNDATDNAKLQAQIQEYQKELEEQQAEAEALSATYYPIFKQYESRAAAFDSNVGDSVKTTDLKVGEGAAISAETKYQAYYIGWNPNGKVFDSSFADGALSTPIDTSQTTLIEGWNEGVVGMNVGGVREITIPSGKAYGESGSGEDIPANTPIKFIVMIIATK
jgi:FKBP-type peptidyl-prolyl cis-trans isomerase